MYITLQDLLAFCNVLINVVTLIIVIVANNKKK